MNCLRTLNNRFSKTILSQNITTHIVSGTEIQLIPKIVGDNETLQTTKDIKDLRERNVLEPGYVDLSTIVPSFPESFNLAGYVNKSETLQKLIQLNVNLSKIEKKPFIARKILELDFERDIKNHLRFLNDYVNKENLGDFLTKNPLVLCEDLEDLEVRVNYLKSKSFLATEINRIITQNPFWLMFSTIRIDRRLGYFQKQFELSGKEIRSLATTCPKIVTYNLHHIRTNSFVIKEEMGFDDLEIKELILKKPRLWIINQRDLLERFNYIHNTIKIDHKTILKHPGILLSRLFRLKQRHLFLQKLGRDQYDLKKSNYVPISALVEDTDLEFCRKYAKCNISDFNIFLKTL